MEEKKIFLSELFKDAPLSVASIKLISDMCRSERDHLYALVEFNISGEKKEWAYIAPAYCDCSGASISDDTVFLDLSLVERADEYSGEKYYCWDAAFSVSCSIYLSGDIYYGEIPSAECLKLSDAILNYGRFKKADRDKWVASLTKRYEKNNLRASRKIK